MHSYKDPYSGKRKSLAHNRKQIGKRKRERLMKIVTASNRWYRVPVYWSDFEFDLSVQVPKPAEGAYIVRHYRPLYSRYVKTRSHRKARRKGAHDTTYHKIGEYWWEMY